MKGRNIIPGVDYLAYVGSLARVRVVRTEVEQTLSTGRVVHTGVEVEVQEDVPWAIDPARIVHRKGERFIVASKHFVGEAE